MTSRLLRLGLAPALGLAVAYVAFAGPRRDVAAVSDNDVTVGSGTLLPPNHEREVARLVADHLEHFHYTDRPIDDTLSRQWFGAFLDRLDYQRTVFLAEDIASFEAYRESFDDIVDQRRPDLSAPVRMYTIHRQRLRSRLAYVQKLLNKGVNVKDRETFVADRHEADAAWPANEREANELWRKRIEDEFIGEMLGGDDEDEVIERLKKRYANWERILDQEESADLVESWLGAMTRTYDPHSEWFKPAKNDDFDIDITNSVTGIGASLRTEGDETVIVDLIAGGPAEKDGRLGPEDVILSVGQGKRGEMVDVVGWRIEKVVKLIRGEVKTRVRLLVEHPDKGREEITIIRELVTLEDSAAEHRVEEIRGRKLGVVRLPSFYVAPDGSRRRASTDVHDALVELNQQGAEGLVLDLRGNGGGSLLEAIDVTGLFITTGPVVQVRTRPGRIEALHDRNPQVSWVKDMVVLIDETSASASEIVAGALQDYGRALVVGAEQTHGKGTVQQVLQLTNRLSGKHAEPVGGALKLTIQKFYRVSGSSTQNRGVVSDLVLPSRWQGLDILESDLPTALPWDRIPPAPFVRVRDDSELVPRLADASAKRVAASEDFGTLARVLREREQLNAQTDVSLHFATRKMEFEARKSRIGDDEEPEEPGTESPHSDDRDGDYVLDETLQVLSDLLDQRTVGR